MAEPDRIALRDIKKRRAKALLDLLKVRFGWVPARVRAKIQAADEVTLSRWSLRVLSAESMRDVLVDPQVEGGAAADWTGSIMTELDEIELRGFQKGLTAARIEALMEARREGRAQMLLSQLRARFGSIPAKVSAQIHSADEATLSRWSLRVLTASSLSEVFAEGNGKSSPGRRPGARKPVRRS